MSGPLRLRRALRTATGAELQALIESLDPIIKTSDKKRREIIDNLVVHFREPSWSREELLDPKLKNDVLGRIEAVFAHWRQAKLAPKQLNIRGLLNIAEDTVRCNRPGCGAKVPAGRLEAHLDAHFEARFSQAFPEDAKKVFLEKPLAAPASYFQRRRQALAFASRQEELLRDDPPDFTAAVVEAPPRAVTCAVCGDGFDKKWDDGMGLWVLCDAVRSRDDTISHFECEVCAMQS